MQNKIHRKDVFPMKKVFSFDSTLRDGAQSEGISFSVFDKLHIVKILDEIGVDYIEAGNPGSNPKDLEFFEKAACLELKHAKLCAFGSTRRKDLRVEQDENVLSLLKANTQTVAIFGKSWDLHIHEILKTTEEDNLCLIRDTVAFFKKHGKEVIFDAEHFFDGYHASPSTAISVLQAACDAGADTLCLCDTNGGTMPHEIGRIVKLVSDQFPTVRVGIHCHDDIGCAVASSLLAVENGASHVQGTLIGIGERCGNADLSIIAPNLQLKEDYQFVSGDLKQLSEAVFAISELSNLPVPQNKPYVGRSAFAHKGGMHIDGVHKCPRSFEHVDPASVGNERRFLLSEVSGRSTVLAKLAKIAPALDKQSPQTAEIMAKVKELEHLGYQFESADASFELVALKLLNRFESRFRLILYKTSDEFPAIDESQENYAMLQLEVNGTRETSAATGNGPVNALDLALRKALQVFYPGVTKVHLVDYKVRVLTPEQATGAVVRVLIESTDGKHNWNTVGVSHNVIQASWLALADSLEYFLMKYSDER